MSESSITSATAAIILGIPKLEGEHNYHSWIDAFHVVFGGIGADYLTGDTLPATVPTDGLALLDKRLVLQIWSRIDPSLQYLVTSSDDKTSALEVMRSIRGKFQRSSMARRIKARHDFHHVHHDPSQPIDIYIQSVAQAVKVLKELKCSVDDTEQLDVLLMNLDDSYATVRTSILSQKEEPSLEDAKAILTGASISAVAVKIEPDISHGAFGAAAFAAPREHRRPSPSPSSGAGSIDNKGFRWCDPTKDGHCHRCGRTGHVAYLCIFDMPRAIKDWVMRAPPSTSVSDSANYTTIGALDSVGANMEVAGMVAGLDINSEVEFETGYHGQPPLHI